MLQDLEEALCGVALKEGIPDVKFSKVMVAHHFSHVSLAKTDA